MAVPTKFMRGSTAAATAAALFLVTACGGGAAGGAQQAKDRVVAAVSVDVSTLDPSAQYSANATGTFSNIFDSLTTIGADGALQPALATEWAAVGTSATWDFKLRPGVKFSNGEVLDADDVVFTFKHILDDPKSPYKAPLASLQSVEKVDSLTVRFVHKAPRADFPRLANVVFMLPNDTYPKAGADFARKPIGSGPYVVKDWKRDDTMELARNESYWGKRPALATAALRVVPSASAAASALRAGDVDIVPSLAPEQVSSLREARGVRVAEAPTNRVAYLGLNLDTPALANADLRKAIDIALDRPAMVKLLVGQAEPVGQPVSPSTFGYSKDVTAPVRDIEAAKRLVAASGYNGAPIPFTFPSDRFAAANDLAQLISGQLKEAGITVELKPIKYTAFLPLWFNARKDLPGIYLSTYGPSSMDGATPVQEFLVNANRTAFADPAVISLNQAQLSATEDVKRADDLAGIWKASAAQVPYAWLYFEKQTGGVRDGVAWTPRADTAVRFADIG